MRTNTPTPSRSPQGLGTLLRSLAGLLCILLTLSARGADTGTVAGRVLNSASGQYLEKVRVQVSRQELITFTNGFGEYRIDNVPAGTATLRAEHTGLPAQVITVEVRAGTTTERDIVLRSRGTTSSDADPGARIELDPFVVATGRETNAANIAANEQRHAPNIQNVVSADAFGDVTEGNVGEFMKFLPGVVVNFVGVDARSVAVRGLPDFMTNISTDGARIASASSGNARRVVEFEQLSINNVARIEVVKVPTPSHPADSLGGSINLVSKSAFERPRAQLRYRLYGSVNDENLSFSRTPGHARNATVKILPGFDFEYALPVNKNFGIVVSALASNQFTEEHRSSLTWNFAQAGATVTNPYLQSFTLGDGPKVTNRLSGSFKADWRVAPGHVLSFGVQHNRYRGSFSNRFLAWNAGTTATPVTAGGESLTWGPSFTRSATGRASIGHTGEFRDKFGHTTALNVLYRVNQRTYDLEAGLNGSMSKNWYRDTGRGHFADVRTTLLNLGQVRFGEIAEPYPRVTTAHAANGATIDHTQLANYRVDSVRSRPVDSRDEVVGAFGNVRRRFPTLPFAAAVKAGIDVRSQERDMRRSDISWNFAGVGGDTSGARFVDPVYSRESVDFSATPLQWPDLYALHDLFRSNPSAFPQTADQQRNAERFRIQNSQLIEETVTAAFVQTETRHFNSRLQLVAGVRFESTKDEGLGPLTRGGGLTLAAVQANWRERGLRVSQQYEGYYPSFHANFNVTENLIARFAYARTLGRPDFTNIVPLARVNDQPVTADDGLGSLPANTIVVNNTGLKPWEADNFDLSLEYYRPQGGMISAGVFRKLVSDFWSDVTRTATTGDIADLALDPAFAGFTLRTKENGGDARIDGYELNAQLPLDFIPTVGRHLNAFANYTRLSPTGDRAADFSQFIRESASWGVTYSRSPLIASLKWNYRGRQRNEPQAGAAFGGAANGFYEYFRARINVDLNLEYQLHRRLSLFLNGRNVFDKPQERERSSPLAPGYSDLNQYQRFGVQYAVGIKGTF